MILSALLITACDHKTQIVDELEPTGTSASAQTEQSVGTAVVPPENGGETSFVLGGGNYEETTTAASVTTVSETEADMTEFVIEEASLEYEKLSLDVLLAEGESFSGGIFISGNTAAMACYDENGGVIRFFDLDDMTVKADIPAPEGWALYGGYSTCIEGGGEVLCKIPLSYNEKEQERYAAITVYSDFTTEFAEGEPSMIFSFLAGEHNISDYPNDIVDTDSGDIIVEGFEDTETDLGFNSRSYDYNFSIDGDRFVYRICGFESMPGFGYYDFSAGTATNFRDSRNLFPIGYKGGKIYAKEGAWDGMCQGELYTFDIETAEKEHFMSSPAEIELNDYTEYYMPQGANYIAANYYDFDNSQNTVYIISPESGEVLAQSVVETKHMNFELLFMDNNRFAAYDDNANEVIVFTVTY